MPEFFYELTDLWKLNHNIIHNICLIIIYLLIFLQLCKLFSSFFKVLNADVKNPYGKVIYKFILLSLINFIIWSFMLFIISYYLGGLILFLIILVLFTLWLCKEEIQIKDMKKKGGKIYQGKLSNYRRGIGSGNNSLNIIFDIEFQTETGEVLCRSISRSCDFLLMKEVYIGMPVEIIHHNKRIQIIEPFIRR